MAHPTVIAIDGPSGSGKSSVSRAVATELGFDYLDTGAMYRAMTWWMLDQGIDVHDVNAVAAACREPHIDSRTDPQDPAISVDGVDVSSPIRGVPVTEAVSFVSAVPAVRALLVEKQRQAAQNAPRGIVIEGRDIGTVVMPNADVKIYLTADPEIRAARRAAEDAARAGGADVDDAVLKATHAIIAKRDHLDSNRETSPLSKADGAVHVDATELTLEQVIDTVLATVRQST